MEINAFHGSPGKFKSFSEKIESGVNYGPGIYFAENFEEASSYALRSDSDGIVVEALLKLSNPFDVRSLVHAKLLIKRLDLKWASVSKREDWKDSDTGLDESDHDNFYAKISLEYRERLGEGLSLNREIREEMESIGFDGIYDPIKKWWVAFRLDQIKIVKRHQIKFKG